MFTYRKNIDAEKRHELKTEKKIQTDEMTGLLNKTATRQHISAALTLNPEKKYAFSFSILIISSRPMICMDTISAIM